MKTQLYTVGTIAQEANVLVHRVEYLIIRRKIQPSGRLGRYRIFTHEQIEPLFAELAKTKQKTGGAA